MTADCSTRLSIRLLSDISQGRGAHVAMETVSMNLKKESIIFNIFYLLADSRRRIQPRLKCESDGCVGQIKYT